MGALESLYRSTRYRLRVALDCRPRLFLPLARLRCALRRDTHPLSPRAVDGETDLVIEGFPRSGNTFAVAAFQSAQGGETRVAHHFHSPAQVKLGLELGVPVLVLVREPAAAVSSLMLRLPFLSLALALESFQDFHAPLIELRERIVVAEFGEVTGDFGRVLERINSFYGTTFTPFEHSEENVRECFAAIEERNRRISGGRVDESGVARPSKERGERRQALAAALEEGATADLLAGCQELYRRMLGR